MSVSRRAALAGAAASTAALAVPFAALARRVDHAAAVEPSPLAVMAQRCRETADAFCAAAAAAEDAEAHVYEEVRAKESAYRLLVQPIWLGPIFFTFEPWNRAQHTAVPDMIRSNYERGIAQLGKSIFIGAASSFRQRMARWQDDALAEAAGKLAAYNRLHAAAGIDDLNAVGQAADRAATMARDALFAYRPRNMAEVAEKASAVIEIDDCMEGLTASRLAQLLASFGGKAVAA